MMPSPLRSHSAPLRRRSEHKAFERVLDRRAPVCAAQVVEEAVGDSMRSAPVCNKQEAAVVRSSPGSPRQPWPNSAVWLVAGDACDRNFDAITFHRCTDDAA